ncbi:P-loop NTPase fold protein [Enterococcus hirae]|uniref:P-loop NTPase fold protein n=1 Tax=Enterococcus hirae TaxID=1354 RepID=UPI00200430FA|nr:P-loop NTPase fold protein [Enterococcus hirae]MCK6147468.1 KAP family NTPase [Enterococcus hirae]MCK6175214.1 KAP family NTPase [Enterococcus hirae]
MEHLEEIIRNYLRTEEPYALQIDGDWGVGKTYYVKNNIEKKLRGDLNYVVYFSVYGYDSLNQIKK